MTYFWSFSVSGPQGQRKAKNEESGDRRIDIEEKV